MGVGSLGWHHARLYKECETANLVGVYDADMDRAAEIAGKLEVKPFKSLDELTDQVEALSVVVPTHLHAHVSTGLLDRGKHLLIEKPITETTEQARALIQHAQDAGAVLQVGHVERFNPVIEYLESKADDPRFIEAHRLAPYPPPRPGLPPRGTEVGVVLDLMIHDIDLILNLVKHPIKHIDAVGIPVLSDTEDIANARIRFENGCVANLTASRVTPEPMRKIRVFQSNAYISLDYQAKSGELFSRKDHVITREEVPIHQHNALLKELEHFLACVMQARMSGQAPTPKVSGVHGLQALEVAVEIRRLISPNMG